MTLNRVMAVIFRHFTQAVAIGANYVKLTEARPIVSATKKCSRKILLLALYDSSLHTRASLRFFSKIGQPHLLTIRVVQHCAAISATVELLVISDDVYWTKLASAGL